MRLEKASMQFSLDETAQHEDVLEAYERLIHDAMTGDHTLFTTADGIERLWEISAPLLEDPSPLHAYAPGSWGPPREGRPDRAARAGGCRSSASGAVTAERSGRRVQAPVRAACAPSGSAARRRRDCEERSAIEGTADEHAA